MAIWVPTWAASSTHHTIPVTLGTITNPLARLGGKDLSVTGYQLVWASILSGRPPHLAPNVLSTRDRWYRHWRVSTSLGMLEPSPSGGLRRTDAFHELDPTEQGHLNYALAGAITKAYLAKLGIPWLAHMSLVSVARQQQHRVGFMPAGMGRARNQRDPDYLGIDRNGDFIVAEAKGRKRLRADLKRQLDTKTQTGQIHSIDGTAPAARYGVAVEAGKADIRIYATDPPTHIDELDRSRWIHAYYDTVHALSHLTRDDPQPEYGEWVPVSLTIPPPVTKWLSEEAPLYQWAEIVERVHASSLGLRTMPDLTTYT